MRRSVRTQFNPRAITSRVKKATYKTLEGTASLLRRAAAASIRVTNPGKTARPGRPPHSRGRSHSLKTSIRYYVDQPRNLAVIGPDANITSLTGHYHEFGGAQIRGRRRTYSIGKVGPVAIRPGYTSPLGTLRKRIPGSEGIVWARLKTQEAVDRARRLDLLLFPNVVKKRNYPQRPFMAPALARKQSKFMQLFKAQMQK